MWYVQAAACSGLSERASSESPSEVYAERNPANLHVVKVTEANLTYVAIDRESQARLLPKD